MEKKPPTLIEKLHLFLASKPPPTIRLHSNIMEKYGGENDVYGVFDPDESQYIYISEEICSFTWEYSTDNFLIFSKIIHELCHWITHITMKHALQRDFSEEKPANSLKKWCLEVVSHHSRSGVCSWEIGLILKGKQAGSQEGHYFEVDFMTKRFFDKDTNNTIDTRIFKRR